MTVHDLIMGVMCDGVERSTAEITDIIYNEQDKSRRLTRMNRINSACNTAVKYGILEKTGRRKKGGTYVQLFKAAVE